MAQVGRLVKDKMVEELSGILNAKPNFFVASLGPLKAIEADTLRKRLRGTGTTFLVVKRTLGLRGIAARSLNGGTASLLAGSVVLVFPAEDVLKPAKVLVEFAKTNRDKLVVRGGWIDGQLLSQQWVEQLASLPPKPQLIAQVIGVLESPIAELIFVLEGLLGEVAWIVEEASKTKPSPQKPPSTPATDSTPPPSDTSTSPGATPPPTQQEEGTSDA